MLHFTFFKIEGVVIICFPFIDSRYPEGQEGFGGTRVVPKHQHPLGEIVGYLGIQEQLKEPEAIKLLISFDDNSR